MSFRCTCDRTDGSGGKAFRITGTFPAPEYQLQNQSLKRPWKKIPGIYHTKGEGIPSSAAAKAAAGKKDADFFHNLALKAQKAMEQNALQTLKVFSGKE